MHNIFVDPTNNAAKLDHLTLNIDMTHPYTHFPALQTLEQIEISDDTIIANKYTITRV